MKSFRKKVEMRRMRTQHRGSVPMQQRGKPASDSESTDPKVNGYGGGTEPLTSQLPKQSMKMKISKTGMIEQLEQFEQFTIESKSKKKPVGATAGQPAPAKIETKLSLNQIKEKQAGTAVTTISVSTPISNPPTQMYSGNMFAPVQDQIPFARTTSASNLTQVAQQQPVTVAPAVMANNIQWAQGVGLGGEQAGWIPSTTTSCNGQYIPVMPIQQQSYAAPGNISNQPLRQQQHQQLPHR